MFILKIDIVLVGYTLYGAVHVPFRFRVSPGIQRTVL
ncbi:hypothetical protein SPIROBIBN47_210131 [uncultured spirochete]|uniref:Uncharacterized protein n=1 Tax=uncultured spirochete TaxID=156406 RepID=A0A3P3XHE7_9SPIR|nr:hypothetical protein SPIROBIBN47_210131 [uncultured spirochete]